MIRARINNPTFFGFIALLLWATGSTVASYLRNLPPFEFILLMFFVIGSTTLVKIWIKKEWSSLRISWKEWMVVIFGVGVQQIFYILAFSSAPPAEADVIIFLWPLMAIVLSSVLLGQPFRLRYGISTLLGVSAVLILSYDKFSLTNVSFGHVFALLCAFSWSLYTVLTRNMENVGINVIGMSTFCGFFIALGFHVSTEQFVIPRPEQFIGIAYYSLGICFGAYILWTKALQEGKPNYLTLSAYMKPILSLCLLCLFGFAVLSHELIIAVILVTLGGLASHPILGSKLEGLIYSFMKQYKLGAHLLTDYKRVLPST